MLVPILPMLLTDCVEHQSAGDNAPRLVAHTAVVPSVKSPDQSQATLGSQTAFKPNHSLEQIYQQLQYSTVALNITVIEQNGKEAIYTSSGILVAPDQVVSTYHGFQGGQLKHTEVRWDSRLNCPPQLATIVATDVRHDLVLLRLSHAVTLTPLVMSKIEPLPGEPIAVLGFPEVTQVEDEKTKYLHIVHGFVASFQPTGPDGLPQLILDARVLKGNSGGPVISMNTLRLLGIISEVVLDTAEEEQRLPSGATQKQSIEGESLGIAIAVSTLQKLLKD